MEVREAISQAEARAKTTITIRVDVVVTKQTLIDALITAFEQGIGYWATQLKSGERRVVRKSEEAQSEFLARNLLEDGTIDVVVGGENGETPDYYTLTRSRFIAGMAQWIREGRASENVSSVDDLGIEYDIDAEQADVIVQFALFGKVIYG